MTQAIIQQLEQASADLLMMSESDYPFKTVFWEDVEAETLTPAKILELTEHPQGTPVEIVDIDHFFRNCAVEKEWHDDQQKENVQKFKNLVDTLKNNLHNINVYRVGTISIDVYIIGKIPATQNLAGISTIVIET
jgi:hypothetical protein